MHLSQTDGSLYFYADMGWFLLFCLSCSLSLYLSSVVQQQQEPRGGSLLLQSQSHGRHWFYTQPEWGGNLYLYVDLWKRAHDLVRLVICDNDKEG